MTVIRNQVNEEANFSVDFNSTMYSILSKLVYTDPILAVVREICNNAMDAHVEAGVDKPITVQLPNHLEPVFKCRDYGTGMSHNDIMTLYSTYGASTKRDSVTQVGMFGIGSKSPLAYNEQFVVTSYHGGEKRTYTAYKNEGGTPSIALMHTEPSSETGIEISLSVKQGDYDKFRIAAERVFELFDPHPIIKGSSSYTKRTVNYVGTFSSAKLRDSSVDYNTRSRVVVGRIAYPLKPEQFNGQFRDVFNANFDIYVNMRDVTISASREELFYDDKTKAAVEEVAKDILANVKQKFYDEMNAKCNTWLEAVKFWYDNSQSYSASYRWALHRVKLYWNGRELNTGEDIANFFEVAKDLSADRARYEAIRFVDWYNCRNPIIVISNHRNTRARVKYNYHNYDGRVYIAPQNAWRALYTSLGGAKVVRASTLADKPRKPVQRNPTASVSVPVGRLRLGKAQYDGRGALEEVTVDIKQGGFYIILDNYKMYDPTKDTRMEHSSTDNFLNLVRRAGFCDKTDVLFVSRSVAKKFEKAGNWHELNQYVADAVKPGFTRNELRQVALARAWGGVSFSYEARISYKKLEKTLETVDMNHHFIRKTRGINKYKNNYNILEAKVSLYIWFFDSKDLYINPIAYNVYESYKNKIYKAYASFNEKYDFLLRLLRACNSDEECVSICRAYTNGNLT